MFLSTGNGAGHIGMYCFRGPTLRPWSITFLSTHCGVRDEHEYSISLLLVKRRNIGCYIYTFSIFLNIFWHGCPHEAAYSTVACLIFFMQLLQIYRGVDHSLGNCLNLIFISILYSSLLVLFCSVIIILSHRFMR